MKTPMKEKPRLTPLNDPAEIASVQRNGLRDINGFQDSRGMWFGYSDSVERFRRLREREKGNG